MRIFLYTIFLLACNSTILVGAATQLLPTPTILDLHEEITAAKAFDCYKLYEKELNGKPQETLDLSLGLCLLQPAHTRQLYRQKVIALLLRGAQPKNIYFSSPLSNAVSHDDIPLARYICTHHPEDPNRPSLLSTPLWFYCKSPEMAQLMTHHGADLNEKDVNGNVIHSLNNHRSYLNPTLVEFYCTRRPQLLDEQDRNGNTPLLLALERLWISTISNAYILINLGAKTDIRVTTGKHAGKSAAELVRNAVQTQKNEKDKNEFLVLAEYIEHPPKIHSSLFAILLEQWHDKLDLEVDTFAN